MEKSVNSIVAHLAMQEEAIAELYGQFCSSLPEMESFWDRLVVEERAHAEVIWKLHELKKTSKIHLNTRKFSIDAIRTNLDFIRRQTEDCQQDGITLIRALSLAVDIERGLIEKEFFRIFESDSPRIINEFESLEQHSAEHLGRVEKRLKMELSYKTRINLVEAQQDSVRKLRQCEASLSELYRLYAESIPEMKADWTNLANIEKGHATLLETFCEGINSGKVTLNMERFNADGVRMFLALTQRAVAQAQKGSVQEKEALITAISIESSMLDADFFKYVNTDDPIFRNIAIKISSDTEEHMNTIQKWLKDRRSA